MKKINIILPVYNESEGIEDFNRELFEVLDANAYKYSFEVIYVLDKSTDNTSDKIRGICSQYYNVQLVCLSRRFGHQMSLVAGIDQCDGDAVIMMDSDLEHPPSVIPILLEKYEGGYDIVNTKRIYNHKVSVFKKYTSSAFYKLVSKISSVEISQDSADFRLVSKRVVEVLKNDIREQNQFLRGLIPWIGFNQTYVTFVSQTREKGVSKYNLKRLMNFAIVGIISFSKVPLKISSFIGLVISCLSFLYGIAVIIIYFLNRQLPQGWTSLIAVVSFLGGLQLISLGIIGEYIGGIFDEVKKRPLYIIEEICKGKSNE